ncbi:hypothetical protein D046_4375B, partial [Vibrio parahaemolyticus V-223/04]
HLISMKVSSCWSLS